ncbi:MAG: phage tail length tape measure family protein [Pseudolabrys sp.]|nr:phage tail length tape measure family protein [Pseudolabrys sp.]
MTTTVTQAIYQAQVRGREQLDALAKTLGVVEKAEEKVTVATAATSKGFENLVGRLDPAIRANQQYQATLERLARYEQAGIGTAQQRGVAMALAQQKYQEALSKSSVANDNLRQSAMAAQAALSQMGLGIPILAVGGKIAGIGALIGAAGLASNRAVTAFQKFEEQSAVLDSVLKSTGMSAGRTAAQIQDLVNGIGDIAKTRDAATVLLTFKTIATDTFDRTLKLADDLAAVMKTDISSAAMQLGKALEDPEKGLSALTRSGVSFSSQQKEVIKDLYETGRVAEAQGLILDQVARQVGGAGAAQDAGLSGAYEALSDATQRLMERWGKQIAQAWNLSAAIRGIASAIDAVNKRATEDPGIRIESEIARTQGTLSSLEGRGGSIAAQARARATAELNRLLIEQRRLQQLADSDMDSAAYGQMTAEMERRREAYDGVTRAIQKETEELRKSELQKAIDANLRKAQVDAASAQGQEIIRLTTLKHNEAEAIKRSTEAAKEAVALSKKQEEGLRRFNEELSSRMTKLEAERAGIGLTTEAALALKTAEDDLARLRERNIPVDETLEQNIRDRAAEYAKERIAVNELKAEYDNLNSAITGFGQNLVSSLLQGKSVMESLTGAASQLTSKLASGTVNRVMAGKSPFGNQNLMSGQGAVGVASAGLAGYESASPMMGALGGALAGAAFGPVGAVVGGIVGMVGGLIGQSGKAKKEFEEAQKAWQALAAEVGSFKDQLRGNNTGSLGRAISDATEKAQKYADAAHKAGEGTQDLNDALIVFAQRVTRDFIIGFDVMAEALDQGLGADSPAVQAQQNVRKIGESLKAFMEDTARAGQGLAQAQPAIVKAAESARDYALSLLQTVEPLTQVQDDILTLRGAAQQLQHTLQDLGFSAEQAAAAVSSGIKAQLDFLRSTFNEGQQATINDASGRGYLNQLAALRKQSIADMRDAQALGAEQSLVAESFLLQAQQIIDGASLVGSAFDDLIEQFPDLAGVLSQSAGALDAFAKDIDEFLTGLKIGTLTTLSPSQRLAAAQSSYETTLGKAADGDTHAMGALTGVAETLLTVARDNYASSPEYARIFDRVQRDLGALPAHLRESGNKTTSAIDAAMLSLKDATAQSAVDISASVAGLANQQMNIAVADGSFYFGPMRDYLAEIAANTRLSGSAAGAPGFFESPGGTPWLEMAKRAFGQLAQGGIVGAYAPGGIVGNGIWNKDSVLASYAGGRGSIALAGGEGIINAAATSMIGPSVIELMNRTGRLPSNDNGMGGQDYTPHFMNLARVTAQGFNGQTEVLVAELRALRAEVRKLSDDKRIEPQKRPGTRAA